MYFNVENVDFKVRDFNLNSVYLFLYRSVCTLTLFVHITYNIESLIVPMSSDICERFFSSIEMN